MAGVKGKTNNPRGRPAIGLSVDLRELISKDAPKLVKLIQDVVSGKEKTEILVKGELIKVPLSLEKRTEFAFKLLNKLIGDRRELDVKAKVDFAFDPVDLDKYKGK